jgi:hypothetical protein
VKADVAFVSCVKMKVDHPAPAKDLYVSPWFRMARAYVERNARSWFILSAAHGLVDPGRVIEPYDVTLNRMGREDQRGWTRLVKNQLNRTDLCGGMAVILAGLNYRRGLITPLLDRFGEVEVPMNGLTMGRQLSWLSRNN